MTDDDSEGSVRITAQRRSRRWREGGWVDGGDACVVYICSHARVCVWGSSKKQQQVETTQRSYEEQHIFIINHHTDIHLLSHPHTHTHLHTFTVCSLRAVHSLSLSLSLFKHLKSLRHIQTLHTHIWHIFRHRVKMDADRWMWQV